MGKILVASSPMVGHVNPMLVVAEFLHHQGHEILFNTSEIFRKKVEDCGIRFLPLIGKANYDYHLLGELIPEAKTAASHIDLYNIYAKRLLGDPIPDQYAGIRQIINDETVNLVITEAAFLGILPLLLRPELRPPVVSCGTVAPMWQDPAFSVLTGPDDTPEGIVRNIEHNRQWNAQRAPSHSYVGGVLEKLGAQVPGGFNLDAQYAFPDLFLQLGAEEFEFPRHNKLANLRFVGPILPQPNGRTKLPGWLETLSSAKPVVFVTQGTLANYDFNQLVNPTVTALTDEDVQVIVTAGGGAVDRIATAANAIVEAYLPYELILPKTSVFVTNGGYNGVQQALSYGVPIVSAGASEDKPQVCARVAWSGTGVGMKTGHPTSEQIRLAVREVLRDQRYREQARKLGISIAKTNALSTIAQIVHLTLEGKPLFAAG